MSITTKTGDEGMTSLLFGKRVSKTHSRVQACGAVDELSAVLGAVRLALGSSDPARSDQSNAAILQQIQKKLIHVMCELMVLPEDWAKFRETPEQYSIITQKDVDGLESYIANLESKLVPIRGWLLGGDSPRFTSFNQARTIARRAERCVWEVIEEVGGLDKLPEEFRPTPRFLNRLSDLLWLMGQE